MAGISITEQRELPPGLICDMYAWRREYDDMENGIKRENTSALLD